VNEDLYPRSSERASRPFAPKRKTNIMSKALQSSPVDGLAALFMAAVPMISLAVVAFATAFGMV
jgi:hypothetical protein